MATGSWIDERWRWELILIVGIALLLPSIWLETSVSGSDESHATFRTVLETVSLDSWWLPQLDGEPRLRKPPLMYWLLCASTDLFGASFFSMRIWGVLMGAFLALLTARLFRLTYGGDGTLAALLVLASIGIATESRRAMLDIPLALLTLAAIERGLSWWLLGGGWRLTAAAALLAGAFMVKGPPALLFSGSAVIAIAWTLRERHPSTRWLHLLPAALTFLLLALPWPLSMALTSPLFLERLQEQLLNREPRWIHWQWLPSVAGGALGLIIPWSLTLPGALRRGTIRAAEGIPSPGRWLVLTCAVAIVPFFFIKTFERYLIPLVPLLCILVSAHLESLDGRRLRKHLIAAALLLALPVLGFAAFVFWFHLSGTAALLAAGAWAIVLVCARRGMLRQMVLATAGTIAIVVGFLLPAIGIGALPDNLPADIDTSQVATIGSDQPVMVSMRLRRLIPVLPRDPEALADSLPSEKIYLFASSDDRFAVLAAATGAGREARAVLEFSSFRSRKTYLRFARADAGWPEWRRAIVLRDLETLRPQWTLYLVSRK